MSNRYTKTITRSLSATILLGGLIVPSFTPIVGYAGAVDIPKPTRTKIQHPYY